MSDIFDIEISIYKNVFDNHGAIGSLRDFLSDDSHEKEIQHLRSLSSKEERNEIKKRLPQACISGIFSPTRRAENLVSHSGFICIDIDKQDNEHITNFSGIKNELAKLPQVAYISQSVSGAGYFLIIPIKFRDFHQQHFEQLRRDFETMGVIVDKSCADLCRLRCMSWDEKPYINADAIPYERLHIEPKVAFPAYHDAGEIEKVERCCRIIDANGIDITSDYNSWFLVGCALASIGETGRGFFHICSRQNPSYKFAECDKKFTNLVRTGRRISLGTFFRICKEYNIDFKAT